MLTWFRNRSAEVGGALLWLYIALNYGRDIVAFTKYLFVHPIMFTLVFYLLFLVYGAWRSAKERGEYIPREWEVFIAPVFIYGGILDVAFRILIGTWLFGWDPLPFRKPANFTELTFTYQCRRWKNNEGWRGNVARFIKGGLDWAEPGEHV